MKYAVSGLLLCAAGAITAQGSSTIITFSVDMATKFANGTFNPPAPAGTGTDVVNVYGTFNGWAGPGLQLVQMGSTTIYTNSYNDTGDANGGRMNYRYRINTSDEPTACWDNRTAYLPSVSGAGLVLPTPFFGDIPGTTVSPTVTFQVDMSEQISLGHFNPQSGDTVDVRGSFNGWSYNSAYVLHSDPSILVTNHNFPAYPNGLVQSNVYTLTIPITAYATGSGLPATNAAQDFKYVIDPSGSWENPSTGNDAGNRFFVCNTNQVLPIVNFSDVQHTPPTPVTLNLDMSGVIGYDPYFTPGTVCVWGTFNNWSGGVPLTNNPASGNPNLFSCVTLMSQGTSFILQYRYTSSALGDWVYDYSNDMANDAYRRTILVPLGTVSTNMPVVYFNDLAPNDLLPADTSVKFTVDMTGAVGTDGHVFDPSSDGLYINGMFANGGGRPQAWYDWAGGVNPVAAPAGFQMQRVGTSSIYTNTILLTRGTPVEIQYQYGMDAGNMYGGPVSNEGASAVNHVRVVRSTAFNPYVLPIDTFTNLPPQEPFFSIGNIGGIGSLGGCQLTVGTPVAGKVPVSWLGRPGAHLQTKSDLTTGSWQDVASTDGANWTAGYSSPNGFVSQTNYPASGNLFFRLVKP